jgi:hypothetical protein
MFIRCQSSPEKTIDTKRLGTTYIYWIYITIMVGVHVPIWEKTIRKEREEYEFRERQKLIARQGESSSSVL